MDVLKVFAVHRMFVIVTLDLMEEIVQMVSRLLFHFYSAFLLCYFASLHLILVSVKTNYPELPVNYYFLCP